MLLFSALILLASVALYPASGAAGAVASCGAFTTCAQCNAHPDCAFCQDAADNLVDPTANLGGWVFRQHGLNGVERRSTSAAASHQAASAHGAKGAHSVGVDASRQRRSHAVTDAHLLQHQPPAKQARPLQHHGRLLQQQGDGEDGGGDMAGSADATELVLLEVTAQAPGSPAKGGPAGAAPPPASPKGAAATTAYGEEGLDGGADESAAEWDAVFASGGFCMNVSSAAASTASTGTCTDLRASVCDCDGADVAALPACHAVVDELRRPVLVAGAAFLAAAAVVGLVVAVDLSWRRSGPDGKAGGGSCRGK